MSVLSFLPRVISTEDAETIGVIVLFLSGREQRLEDLRLSTRSIESYIDELGHPHSYLSSFVFPAYRWLVPDSDRQFGVVDQGMKRVEFWTEPHTSRAGAADRC